MSNNKLHFEFKKKTPKIQDFFPSRSKKKWEMICPQYVHNMFITNPKWQVVTGCYCWDKKVILVLGSNLNQ